MAKCPFCVENGAVNILAENDKAYLTRVVTNSTVVPGCYLIIPKEHVESVLGLPDDWHRYYKDLLGVISEEVSGHHNGSYNDGASAGQRVAHVHFWVINRNERADQKSHGLGLAALRDLVNQSA
jgi:diadenosine tetraphosphate (Ap4A) HIT family hydrolase